MSTEEQYTSDISIKVDTQYLREQYPHDEAKFAFAYRITIRNVGSHPMRLINRYWLICDGNGKNTEVRGAGVVGEQPLIDPGASYQYSSGAVLETPVGSMQGYYEMQTSSGTMLKANIPMFTLAVPNVVN